MRAPRNRPSPVEGPVVRTSLLGGLLLVVLTGWLLAAPPGASPDDGYHLGSIWCAEGYQDGVCLEAVGVADPAVALVPAGVLELACFAHDGAVSAACQTERIEASRSRLTASVTNITGQRPNLYYRAAHAMIGDGQDVMASAARVRTMNIVLTALMVTLTALIAHRRLRDAFLLSWAVAAVPLGLFFATTVSSSAWSVAGLSTVWANVITALDHPDRRHRVLGVLLAATGTVMGLGARTEAVAHIAVIGASFAAMWWWRRQESIRARSGHDRPTTLRALGAVLGLGAFGWMLSAVAPESADLDGVIGGFADGYDRIAARDVGEPFLAIIFEVPTLWSGALGDAWGLGVLDVPIPSVASLTTIGFFVALAAIGLHGAVRARTLAVAMFFAALVAMPTLSLLRSGLLVYESLQPRQFMALIYPILGLALYRTSEEPPLVLGRTMRHSLVGGMAFAHAIALLVTIQRHTSGLLPGFDGLPRHVGLGRDIEWWWATLPHPDIIWATASVAYLAMIIGIVRRFRPEKGSRVPIEA